MINILIALPLILLITLANIAVRLNDQRISKLFISFLLVLNIPIFLTGLVIVTIAPEQLQSVQTNGIRLNLQNPISYGIILQITAVWGILVTVSSSRHALFRKTTIKQDSPTHVLGLLLIGYLAGNVALIFSQGGITALAETIEPATIIDIIMPAFLFLSVAFLGVGAFIRRNLPETLQRLGLVKPTALQLLSGIGWVFILIFLQGTVGVIWQAANPTQVELLNEVNNSLLINVDTVWEWALLALAAGIGEEILFRGALQPVFGIVGTAVIFALGHIQYGLSPATFLVFVLGIILGIIRKKHNTTIAIFVHTGYNFALGLLTLALPYLETLAEQAARLLHTL
jgi:membrane protease YdiL (CAAX protease family)